MSSSPPPPYGQSPLRVVQVLGGGSAGSSAHVRSLTAGLVARGVRVTVCAPAELEQAYGFAGAGADVVNVPRRGDPVAVAALRTACVGADVVHAHGLHAAVRAAFAVSGMPAGRRTARWPEGRQGERPDGSQADRPVPRVPLVVTWHTRPHTEGARGHVARLMERRAVRAASVVLGTSSELVDRARGGGARDARLAPVTVPAPRPPTGYQESKARAELGAVERPLLMAVGSLVPHRGYDVLLDASRAWRGLDPAPLLTIAGEGHDRGALQRRIETEDLPVRLIGRREDISELLAAADVAVLPSRWEARSVLAQEALRAGVALVATDVGGVRELVGDAAEFVPYGDADALGRAVLALLDDPERRAALAAAGRRQAATWPTEDETVAQVLSVYDELTGHG
ncbi:glycosyltransferase family 4 protein [Streptomyces sp. NPDC091272]|uniref:glycosyltransferase family 4 protein n=1 Tax=Streptomyces sp. NPDC091272 TaxID=3365981 RepID=UPI00380651A4